MSQAFFTDPLGSWPSDLQNILLECDHFSASPNSYIDIYKEEFVLKSILKPNSGEVPVDKERLGREVDMMLLAGNDCAIPVIGRYFHGGVITGFITPFGKCITQGDREDIRPECHEHRLEVIQQFCALLDRLHSKGIMHGDVKPSNLVFDAAGNLRFIDFAEAMLESEPPGRRASTTRYLSPSYTSYSPLTRADDLYAAGVTIWHIYTRHLPFGDIEEDDVDMLIQEGLRPDLSVIDDEVVKALIRKYLDGGECRATAPIMTHCFLLPFV